MKKLIYICIPIILIIAIIGIFAYNSKKEEKKVENPNFKIVTSFYPIYIMTANIAQGGQNIEIMNLTQNNNGCLHDYTLLATDLTRIEDADVFIQNGLGLENFMDKITQTYSNLPIINSSKDVINPIEENGSINPHIWTSIENYIEQVKTIAEELSNYNPENSSIYKSNSQKYIETLREAKLKYDTELPNLNSKKVICLNESLSYLARDLQMDVTTIITNHEESTMSAETMKNIISKMQQEDIKIIFIDEDDDLKNAKAISEETGAKIYQLSSGITGTIGKDTYLNTLNENFEKLKKIE